MEEFIPIDHKDTDRPYREAVWQSVASKSQSRLRPISSAANLWGTWQVFFAHQSAPWRTLELQPDGTAVQTFPTVHGPELKKTYYAVRPGVLEIDWESYHCALSDQGEVIVFNGDGSLIEILRPMGS